MTNAASRPVEYHFKQTTLFIYLDFILNYSNIIVNENDLMLYECGL